MKGVTKGTWENSKPSSSKRILDNKYLSHVISPGYGIVAEAYGRTKEETEANAALISEAGNIHKETGLSPKEILEQRNILQEALLAAGIKFEECNEALLAAKLIAKNTHVLNNSDATTGDVWIKINKALGGKYRNEKVLSRNKELEEALRTAQHTLKQLNINAVADNTILIIERALSDKK